MFTALINRSTRPTEWQKIPWDDPDFSRRMLAEHLSQSHDQASRRFNIIDQHVKWIHTKVLQQQPANILDLGCGPGFYTSRFTALGHTCTGMDFSPASIDYAREHHPGSEYILGNVCELDYGGQYDLITMIYGELNAFAPKDAERIVNKAHTALKPGGKLLLEAHPYEAIYRFGQEGTSWHTAQKGLFSDEPYLCLIESRFETDCTISYYYVYAVVSGAMQQYITMHQAYTDDEYRHLLQAFERVSFYPSLTGSAKTGDLYVIVAEK
ncbi:MAG: methyltransferase domain-containing protein [Anaerolineae bacterium]|nr:methyltransferase domain-containing protein [Anaerolineae bacterium]